MKLSVDFWMRSVDTNLSSFMGYKMGNKLMEMLGYKDDGLRILKPDPEDPVWDILSLLPADDYGSADGEHPFDRGYTGWSPGADYMWKDGDGWDTPLVRGRWEDFYKEMKDSDIDFNIVADFYFSAEIDACVCHSCDETGLNPETKKISDEWYSFGSERRIPMGSKSYNDLGWQHHVGKEEVVALVKGGRLWDLAKETYFVDYPEKKTSRYRFDEDSGKWYGRIGGERCEVCVPEYPTPEEVNEWSKSGIGHDAINKYICVRSRAERLGVYGWCESCNGRGKIKTGDTRIALYMWLLHPRKGASRGVQVKSVRVKDLPQVMDFLSKSRGRMATIWKWVDDGGVSSTDPDPRSVLGG